MRTVVARKFGHPDELAIEHVDGRPPARDEVRIRVHYAGVSYVDALVVAGRHQHQPRLPFVPGTEMSGEVLTTGADVAGLAPGDRVCGGSMGGMFAQEVVLPAHRVQKLPHDVDMARAAVFRASYLTAWYALVTCGRLAAGETVLVLGAGGAVGIAAIEVARHFGATLIASASTAARRTLAEAHGAQHVLDARAPDWRDRIRAIVGSRGVDVVVDPVGGTATEPAFRSLGYKGRHLVIGFAAGGIPALPVNLPLLKGASLVGVLASYFAEREPDAERDARARILELFAAGAFRPPIHRIYPLDRFAEALHAVSDESTAGRILLQLR